MVKILTIVGARPQFIKAGSVSRAIKSFPQISELLVHTGQHYDFNMSDVFFKEMDIPRPHFFLGINGKTHGAMTGQMLEKIEKVLVDEQPDWVLVYGDTNSTLAGALAASKLGIKLAHVEAGLRSFNTKMPEELNRILTDRLSQLLFCPTDFAVRNLELEGFQNFDCKVIKTGDVMYDGALFYQERTQVPRNKPNAPFVLATVHRAENTDDLKRLAGIIGGLNAIHKEIPVICPLHPRTQKVINKNGLSVEFEVIEPVGYLEMVWYINNCEMVLTDSGGLQKEAFFFKKPCMTLRDETEWVELVDLGFNHLVGSDPSVILDVYRTQKFNTQFDNALYGNGRSCEMIIESLLNYE